ncbi:hypothetical protein HDV04_005434 [Boothiomyces sp. JEL0838]|nr:hypothetical protein HDV04_005434 [Boothiomyces sp. JEL0838]
MSISPVPSEDGQTIALKFKVQVKQFKTQHRNSNIAEDLELSINSLTNFKEKLFEYTQPKIQRLVTIEGEEYSIAEFDPTIEQLSRFAKIRRNQHNYEIDNLTWDILTNWSQNPPYPELSILQFGDHVTNKVRYAKVQSLFYAPAEVDNSGAPSDSVIDEIAAELKRVHSNHFRTMDIVWRIWATDISRKPTHMHPELIQATPPIELMHLFDLATPNDRQWNHFNNANRTAQQVVGDLNERATLTLSDLETFETKFIQSLDSLQNTISTLRNDAVVLRRIVTLARGSVDFTQRYQQMLSTLSGQDLTPFLDMADRFERNIEDMPDIDHELFQS